MNQHQNFQQQTISNPKQQYRFDRQEKRNRPTPSQLHCEHEPDSATRNIAQRIQHRVALITERRGGFAIALNDRVRVLDDFGFGSILTLLSGAAVP